MKALRWIKNYFTRDESCLAWIVQCAALIRWWKRWHAWKVEEDVYRTAKNLLMSLAVNNQTGLNKIETVALQGFQSCQIITSPSKNNGHSCNRLRVTGKRNLDERRLSSLVIFYICGCTTFAPLMLLFCCTPYGSCHYAVKTRRKTQNSNLA